MQDIGFLIEKIDQLTTLVGKLTTRVEELEHRLEPTTPEEVVDPDNQLALLSARVSPEVRDLVVFTAQQMSSQIYREVIEELNETVVPQVSQMIDYVNYNLQDGQEVVDNHRLLLEAQINGINPDTKLITDGKVDKRIITPYIRTVWGGPNEDTSSSED